MWKLRASDDFVRDEREECQSLPCPHARRVSDGREQLLRVARLTRSLRMPLSKNIADLMKDVRKKHGDHAISTATEIPKFVSIPSGSLCLDYITEIGGLPSNRVVEYVGDPGSGKSTLAMHSMNNALKMYPDRYALFIDLEQKLTTDWMSNFV